MSIFQTIKDQQLAARKAKESVRASLLTTILGEFSRGTSKDDPTDDQVFKVVQKIRNGVQESYAASAQPELTLELAILDSILALKPAQATDEEVKAALAEFISATPTANIGTCMKFLKDKFGSTLDGASANGLVRAALTANG